MADNIVKFRYGTYTNYVNVAEKDPNTLYFITDNGNVRLYKGDQLFTQQWQVVNGLPAVENAHTDRLYIDVINNKLAYFNGSTYEDILQGGKVTIDSKVSAEGSNPVSSKAIYDFVMEEISALTGGSTATLISEIVAGDESGTLVVTKGEKNTTVALNGVVVDPTWDATQRILTLPNTTDGKAITINFGKDMVVTSGSYDATEKELVLVIGEDSANTVRIPVESLVDTYNASEDTAGAVQITVENHAIKGSILVDGSSVLKIVDGKLTIDLTNYVTTEVFNELEARVDTLEEDVADHEERIVALNDFIANTLNTRIDERIALKEYDSKIQGLTQDVANIRTEFASQDAVTLNAAKAYTDTKVSNVEVLWNVIS